MVRIVQCFILSNNRIQGVDLLEVQFVRRAAAADSAHVGQVQQVATPNDHCRPSVEMEILKQLKEENYQLRERCIFCMFVSCLFLPSFSVFGFQFCFKGNVVLPFPELLWHRNPKLAM